jgi:hypothetical protein
MSGTITWAKLKAAHRDLRTYSTSDGTRCHLGAFRFIAVSAADAQEKIRIRLQPAARAAEAAELPKAQ